MEQFDLSSFLNSSTFNKELDIEEEDNEEELALGAVSFSQEESNQRIVSMYSHNYRTGFLFSFEYKVIFPGLYLSWLKSESGFDQNESVLVNTINMVCKSYDKYMNHRRRHNYFDHLTLVEGLTVLIKELPDTNLITCFSYQDYLKKSKENLLRLQCTGSNQILKTRKNCDNYAKKIPKKNPSK